MQCLGSRRDVTVEVQVDIHPSPLALPDVGITLVSAQNLDGDDAILAANRAVGFREADGSVDVVRTFDSGRMP